MQPRAFVTPAATAALAALTALAACGDEDRGPAVVDGACAGGADGPRVLVYTRENLWQHPSTPVARDALLAMCASHGFTVTATHDPRAFTDGTLDASEVVVFAVTSGEVLDPPARAAFEPWLRAGGGLVGLHSASATELSWPFFVEAIGAQFLSHAPGLFAATVTVEAPAHPITRGLPAGWARTDEWYQFTDRPEDRDLEVLLALDEATLPAEYPAELRVGYHPIAWAHQPFGGRVFYTAMGHTVESYAEPAFVELIARAILWTAPARGGGS